jgi:hypothetical protein
MWRGIFFLHSGIGGENWGTEQGLWGSEHSLYKSQVPTVLDVTAAALHITATRCVTVAVAPWRPPPTSHRRRRHSVAAHPVRAVPPTGGGAPCARARYHRRRRNLSPAHGALAVEWPVERGRRPLGGGSASSRGPRPQSGFAWLVDSID